MRTHLLILLALLLRLSTAAAGAVPIERKSLAVARVDSAGYVEAARLLAGDLEFSWQGQPARILSRYIFADGCLLAGDWLAAALSAQGWPAHFDTFLYTTSWDTALCRNVVAELRGADLPDEVVVVGAHYDALRLDGNPLLLAPGAEDNASGVAAVLSTARAVAGLRFARTVQIVFFSAEEQGLWGSRHHVARLAEAGRPVAGALVADMVAYHRGSPALILDGAQDEAWLPLLARDNLRLMTALGDSLQLSAAGAVASDHRAFLEAGLPAVLLIGRDWHDYPYYHRHTDTWPRIAPTCGQGVDAARVLVAALADLAELLPDGLPVLASGLTARRAAGAVELSWATGELPPGSGLDILRAGPDGVWTLLTPLPLWPPPGVTSWRDEIPPAGRSWYRLDLRREGAGGATLAGPVAVPERQDESGTQVWALRAVSDAGLFDLRCASGRGGSAQLRVLDLYGRTVRRLWQGYLPAGAHDFAWDGLDERARRAPAGAYLVLLEIDGARAATRLTLVH